MDDTIALVKAISLLLWPISLLLIVFMFRREIRRLLLSRLPDKMEADKTCINKSSETPTPVPTPIAPDKLPQQPTMAELTFDDQLIVKASRNISSAKYSIVLDDNENKIYAIAPDGNIDWFQKTLFHPISENIAVDLLPKEQREKFYWWLQTIKTPDVLDLKKDEDFPISGYLPNYMGMLRNPRTEPSRMLKYIQNMGKISWYETKKYLHNTYGYELTSGSMGASLRALEELNLVTISGQGENKIIALARKV